jgi:hypothetical protein
MSEETELNAEQAKKTILGVCIYNQNPHGYCGCLSWVQVAAASALPEEKEDGFENTFLSLLYEADEPLTRKDVVRVWNAAKEAKR